MPFRFAIRSVFVFLILRFVLILPVAHGARVCRLDLVSDAVQIATLKTEDSKHRLAKEVRLRAKDLNIYISGSALRKARAAVNEYQRNVETTSNDFKSILAMRTLVAKIQDVVKPIINHPRNKQTFGETHYQAKNILSDSVRYLIVPHDLRLETRLRLLVDHQIWMNSLGSPSAEQFLSVESAFNRFMTVLQDHKTLLALDKNLYVGLTVSELTQVKAEVEAELNTFNREHFERLALPKEIDTLIERRLTSTADLAEVLEQTTTVEDLVNQGLPLEKHWTLNSLVIQAGIVAGLAEFSIDEKRRTLRKLVLSYNRDRLMTEQEVRHFNKLEEQLALLALIIKRAGS